MGLLLERRGKRLGKLLIYAYSWHYGGRKIGEHLKNIKGGDQVIKQTFMCFLLECIKVSIGDRSLSRLDFVECLGSK